MALNIVDLVNQAIFDFVQTPVNGALIRGTGAYSSPFRGELFGSTDSRAVAAALQTRRVDILWLGSNPNVPDSVRKITDPSFGNSDFPDFVLQKGSGSFPSCRWDGQRHPSPAWNPIQRPISNWSVYRDVFARIASIEAVTMANFIPWGSNGVDDLLRRLANLDPSLLKRALMFADDMVREIAVALRPRMLVVPLSLGRNRLLDKTYLTRVAVATAKDSQIVKVLNGGFSFQIGFCRLGIPAAYLPHPASLRLSTSMRQRITEEIAAVLAPFMK